MVHNYILLDWCYNIITIFSTVRSRTCLIGRIHHATNYTSWSRIAWDTTTPREWISKNYNNELVGEYISYRTLYRPIYSFLYRYSGRLLPTSLILTFILYMSVCVQCRAYLAGLYWMCIWYYQTLTVLVTICKMTDYMQQIWACVVSIWSWHNTVTHKFNKFEFPWRSVT